MKQFIGLTLALALLGLVACGGEKEASGKSKPVDIKIAYYIKDSIITNFDFFKTEQTALEEKARIYEQKLMQLQIEGQQMLESYQRQLAAGLLSRPDQANKERAMAEKQNQMQVLQDTEGRELENQQMKGNEALIEKLETYGKQYAKNHDYTIFLAWQSAGQILYIDSTMNVTMDFIDFMNNEEKSKAAEN